MDRVHRALLLATVLAGLALNAGTASAADRLTVRDARAWIADEAPHHLRTKVTVNGCKHTGQRRVVCWVVQQNGPEKGCFLALRWVVQLSRDGRRAQVTSSVAGPHNVRAWGACPTVLVTPVGGDVGVATP